MYESKIAKPLHSKEFVARLVKHLLAALALLFVSLVIGMSGYMSLEGLSAIDAFLNSAMLLGVWDQSIFQPHMRERSLPEPSLSMQGSYSSSPRR